MVYKLDPRRARMRRSIMHRITRRLTKEDINKLAAFENHYKEAIHDAVTSVLFEDLMEEFESKRMEAGE